MKLSAKSGATLAAAAAALVLSGTLIAPTAQAAEENVQCFGVNACKGKTSCKTAKSACKGQNACKGQGFVSVTKEVCDQIGGKLEQS